VYKRRGNDKVNFPVGVVKYTERQYLYLAISDRPQPTASNHLFVSGVGFNLVTLIQSFNWFPHSVVRNTRSHAAAVLTVTNTRPVRSFARGHLSHVHCYKWLRINLFYIKSSSSDIWNISSSFQRH
jgi:hypothetical protein